MQDIVLSVFFWGEVGGSRFRSELFLFFLKRLAPSCRSVSVSCMHTFLDILRGDELHPVRVERDRWVTGMVQIDDYITRGGGGGGKKNRSEGD